MDIREEILNEIDRFEQSGISLDTNNFIENLKTIVKASVPEGFVLVPKNKSEAFIKKLNDYLDDVWKDGNGFDDGFVSVSEINHDKIWSLVIEAQEQKA
ncbi:MAG: hypothetical protein H9855_02865 [Candidatus Acinetobacter avistercoris]|nr:hypothetical protein [Candidatus Acinetobacter avistercoris]